MNGTVTVGCKLPNGLILRLFYQETVQELQLGGQTRDVTISRQHPNAPRVHINGNMARHGEPLVDANGETINVQSGYAYTSGVDAEFMEAWMEQNKDSMLVKNKIILVAEKQMNLRAEAKENTERKSGFERINPDNDARMPRRRQQLNGGALNPLETAKV